MSISPYDSGIYRSLFTDVEVAKLFTDSAEIRAMLLVEGALAKAQGALGLIPADAAAAIHRASLEVQIDPRSLAQATGQNGVSVPALVTAFRAEIGDPEAAAYVHWGATSQDIIDTGLILRLRPALTRIAAEMRRLLDALARLADTHADTPMAARTYGQHATPTSFGALAAGWGQPHLAHLTRFTAMRPGLLTLSLHGASGTSAAFGAKADALRAAVAEALDLGQDPSPWHSARDRMAELAGWLTLVSGATGKFGEDLILMTQPELAEVTLPNAGASSTMPQKQNPVGPSVLVAIARHTVALNSAVQGALLHRQGRDGAAWFTEWLSLPQIVLGTAKSVSLAADLAEGLTARPKAMRRNMEGRLGLIYAEALSFALAKQMPRPDAQSKIKDFCRDAEAENTPLPDLVSRAYPALDLDAVLGPDQVMGQAPALARRFAATVAALYPSASTSA